MSLFPDPQWTSAFELRCEVESQFTGNRGRVVAISPGRHLLVEWAPMGGRDGYVVRHSSPHGLRKVEP